MDRARDGVSPLTAASATPVVGFVDLHMHSTASDGTLSPTVVAERAQAAGLVAIALTDHDTVAGVPEAAEAGDRLGIRVIGGCEFSSAAPWGEMHVLGYFLPSHAPELESFLERCRADRVRRGREMVDRLQRLGVAIEYVHVEDEARGGAIGRPHVARAIVRQGSAIDISDAFDRFIGRGRPAFVDKTLPTFREIADVVHSVRGLVSVAHLKDRATRSFLERLQHQGLDAVEIRHPSHDPDVRARITESALRLRLLRTGGSDWHGDPGPGEVQTHGTLGSQEVPLEWLERLEQHRAAVVAAAS